ncbi:tensin-1 [Elysia marginata]|uniref:Tensin-1 n=1 Tax=Elysia marginata TaxID=1093978 RepID=A0AAV4HFS7_9GAST|nr:tensin-1 [Elysia marginata]
MQKVCISISPGIPLRGDILIKCYHKKTRAGNREVMWQCQFHTCAISDNNIVFSKHELDDAVIESPYFTGTGADSKHTYSQSLTTYLCHVCSSLTQSAYLWRE